MCLLGRFFLMICFHNFCLEPWVLIWSGDWKSYTEKSRVLKVKLRKWEKLQVEDFGFRVGRKKERPQSTSSPAFQVWSGFPLVPLPSSWKRISALNLHLLIYRIRIIIYYLQYRRVVKVGNVNGEASIGKLPLNLKHWKKVSVKPVFMYC